VLNDIFLVALDGPSSEEQLVTSAVLNREDDCGMSQCSRTSDFTTILSRTEAALERQALTPGREYALRRTPFTEDCVRVWVRRHGQRFGSVVHPAVRSDPKHSKAPKQGSDAAVVANQKHALEQRVQAAACPRASRSRSLFGRPIGGRASDSANPAPESKKFQDFKVHTKENMRLM